MKGQRVYIEPHLYEPGDYGLWDGLWYCSPPGERRLWCLGNGTSHHKVTEHEDRTITVTPSILISTYDVGTWHGFLERGIWREC